MTRLVSTPPHELTTGLHLYNQNNGISQKPICGQGLFLRQKRSGGGGKGATTNSQLQLSVPSSSKDKDTSNSATTLCMSPMMLSVLNNNTNSSNNNANATSSSSSSSLLSKSNKKRQTKYRGNNMYENMTVASSSVELDTESCSNSSDDIFSVFSETPSTASSSFHHHHHHQTVSIDDLQSPVFVAQFDPLQLTSSDQSSSNNSNNNSNANVNHADTSQQQQPPPSKVSKPQPSLSLHWAASLPAVAEEDSQSEQSSQQQNSTANETSSIWKSIPSLLASFHDHEQQGQEEEHTKTKNDVPNKDKDNDDNDDDVHYHPAVVVFEHSENQTDAASISTSTLASSCMASSEILPNNEHASTSMNTNVDANTNASTSTISQSSREHRGGGLSMKELEGLLRTPNGKKQDKKISKEQFMKEATDGKIQQAMEEQLQWSEQDELRQHHHRHNKLSIFDAAAAFPGVEGRRCADNREHQHQQQSKQHHLQPAMTEDKNESSIGFNPFQQQQQQQQQQPSSTTIISNKDVGHSFRHNDGATNKAAFIVDKPPKQQQQQQQPHQVLSIEPSMQEILSEQQVTLKEMSLQNYQYRRELSQCQDLFGKWKIERELQQSTIADLVKEKDAFANEANFLRNELLSIRSELSAFKSSHHCPKQQQPKQQSIQQEDDTMGSTSSKSTYKEQGQFRSPSKSDERQQQQCFWSPNKSDETLQLRSPHNSENKQQFKSPGTDINKQKGLFRSPGTNDNKQKLQFGSPDQTDSNQQLKSPGTDSKQQVQLISHLKDDDKQKFQFGSPCKSDSDTQFKISAKADNNKQQLQSPVNPNISKLQITSLVKSDDKVLTAVGRMKASAANENSGEHSLISGIRYSTHTKHGYNTEKKPLSSGFKARTPTNDGSASKAQRSVKFHDPPLDKERILFPNNLHNRRLNCGAQQQQPALHDGKIVVTVNPNAGSGIGFAKIGYQPPPTMEPDQLGEAELKDPVATAAPKGVQRGQAEFQGVCVTIDEKPLTPQQQRSLFTPTKSGAVAASRGRTSEKVNYIQARYPNAGGGTNVYKSRLGIIQRNRQQRIGSMNGTAISSTPPGKAGNGTPR